MFKALSPGLPTWLTAAGLFALVALLYVPRLPYHFLATHDDDRTVLAGTEVHDLTVDGLRKLAQMFDPTIDRRHPGLSAEYLPVRDLSFAVDQWFWGRPPDPSLPEVRRQWTLNPVGFRLGNVLLYALCGLGAWAVLRRLGAGAFAAGAAAALWLAHPLHPENVVWISSRKDVLSGVLFLLAILAHFQAQDLSTRRVTGRAAAWVGLSVACSALAMLAKATTVVLLPCLVLCDLVRRTTRAAPPRTSWFSLTWVSYALHALVLAAVLYVDVRVLAHGLGSHPFVQELEGTLPERLLRAAPVTLLYLQLVLVPFGLSALREPAPVFAPWAAWTSLAVLALLAAGAVLTWKRWRAAGAGILWFLGCLVPVTNLFVASPHVAADRYLFLPSLGIAALAGVALARLARRRGTELAAVLLGVLLLATLLTSHFQARRWQSDLALWTSEVRAHPRSPQAHSRLGAAWQQLALSFRAAGNEEAAARCMDESLIALRRAVRLADELRLSPRDLVAARVNLGSILAGRALAKEDPDSPLAAEMVGVLRPIFALTGPSRAEVMAAMRDLPGYAEARGLLDGLYETWAVLRPELEALVAREDTLQLAAWRAVTTPDPSSWPACLQIIERENELALARDGEVDPARLAAEAPGYLRVRRAAAYIFVRDPDRAPSLIKHLRHEGASFPDRLRPSLDNGLALMRAGAHREAEGQLMRLWSAAPQFPEPYRALQELFHKVGGTREAAQWGAAAQALEQLQR